MSNHSENVLSNGNSTITALGANGVFIGEMEKAYEHDSAVVSVYTNQSGTLYLEQSPDGINWDVSIPYVVTASVEQTNSVIIRRQFFRIRYVNGSVAQSFLRIQSLFGTYANVAIETYVGIGLTDSELRASPISVTGAVTTGLSQPLTDTQLRNSPVAVDAGLLQGLTNTELRAAALPVSLSSAPLPTGASTSALQTTGNNTLGSIDSKLVQLTLSGDRLKVDIPAGASGLTNTELRATPVPVSGTVSTGLTQPLTDTQIRATPLPVDSGLLQGLTDTQLRATPVPVSGTVSTGLSQPLTDAQLRTTPVPISGTVSTGLTQPLTDTQIRATALPVSGPLTDTQIRATPLPISGTISTGLSQPITDAQIRATPLPVSGPLTDAQLRAVAVPVSGTVAVTNAGITSLDTKIPTLTLNGDRLKVDIPAGASGLTDTELRASAVPVSAASLPLPSGASTSALQTTGNTSLGNIDTKLVQLTLSGDRLKVDIPAGASGLTDAELRATAVPVSGPLTDTQLRATAVPVSMAAAPTGASTSALQSTGNTSLGNIDTKTPALGQALAAASTPVVLTAAQVTTLTPLSSVGVNNFPATQAVSIAATVAVSGPVTDAQIRATPLPVSGTVSANATLTAETTKVIGTVNIAAAQTLATVTTVSAVTAITNALPTGANTIGTVNPPAITKGTQGTVGMTVQRINDAGRNARHFMLDAYVVGPAVEAVQSVVQWYSNAAVVGTTQPAVVPAGKTLRLQSWTISTKSLATVGSVVVRVRVNTAGLGVLASPVVFSFEVGSRSGATTVAMTGGMDTLTGVFPEGFEIPAGSGLAFSMAGYGPTGTLALQGATRFQVHGYEY